MIENKDGRFVVRIKGRCYGKYRLLTRALERENQVLASQRGQEKPKGKRFF